MEADDEGGGAAAAPVLEAAPGESEDVRGTELFVDSVPVSAVPPDRRRPRRGGGGEKTRQKNDSQPPTQITAKQQDVNTAARTAARTAVRRPGRVREPALVEGVAAPEPEEWSAAAQLSFSRVDPVKQLRAPATSGLAREIGGGGQPQQLPTLRGPKPRSAGVQRATNRDNLNLQVTVDVSDASGAFERRQLSVFSKCTVDQVIGITLRKCKQLDTETDWGSERDYELYVVDASRPAGGIDPDTNPLQGSQKIGNHPGQLNFALVRVSRGEDDVETPRSPALEVDVPGSASASAAAEQESLRRPPPIVQQQLKSAAEELLENVGTQNVCKHCGERIDFNKVSPDKIGSLKKQMDHTGLWKDRWFQLYGNHLVYWSAAKEDLDLASGRGVIHLDASVRIAPSQVLAAPPPVDTPTSLFGSVEGSSEGRSSHEHGTIMAGSMTKSVMDGDETHAGRKLLTQISDPLDDSIEGSSQKLSGGATGPGESGAMSLKSPKQAYVQTSEDAPRVRASGAFPDLRLPGTASVTETEFAVALSHKTYKFRADTSQERDSWVTALRQSAQTLFHTCRVCWKNVDPSSSSDQDVVCRGYLCIQLNPKLPKHFDKRWMVCTTNRREGSTHIVYYEHQPVEGDDVPAQGCIHLYEGENRVSVYASEFEQRTDTANGEYTVYKLNVRRGDDRRVLYKRWSKCDKLQKDLAREHKLPATVLLPKKWQQATDPTRLEKRRCQLNHYFAELSGWANREGLDLWDPSVSPAFTEFISEADDDGTEARSSMRASGTQAVPLDPHGGAQQAQSGSDVATSPVATTDSWEDSYLTIRSERTRETLVPQPPTRLGSFAFGVSQSKPSDNSSRSSGSAVAGAASPAVAEGATGSPREGSGNNPITESSTVEALRDSERELGGSPSGRSSGGGKHYLHLQSPLQTYYLYAETEGDLDRWLAALELPWVGGAADTSPRSAGRQGGSAASTAESEWSAQEDGLERETTALGGGTRMGSVARPGMLDTRVSLSSRKLDN